MSDEPVKEPISNEVPGLAQEQETPPFTASYYGIDNVWNDPDTGFNEDVTAIEDYFKDKIYGGEMTKDKKVMEAFLQKVEKEAGVDKHEIPAVRIAQAASYIKYLQDQARIQRERKRYAITE